MRPWTPAAAAAVLIATFSGAALAAQDRYAVKVPQGLSFGEFRGYETWQPVAVSQVKEGLKVISANGVMMNAYRNGLPAKGKTFPEGSKIVKIQWSPKPNPVSPYAVTIPDQLMSVSFIEKDSKRFPKTNGWAYAQFLYDPATKTFKPNGTGAECGHACHTAVAAQDYIFTAYPPR
ncbi:MAG TPA: cytochrome P460 family protein [Phenylobacterium sp.]|nr:cytochrome P460 family protein [Phenylobacterium sp.]